MISDPTRQFIDGSTTRKFIYEGGSKPFHFSPADNNLSKSYECNVIFFANDLIHAKFVLKRMFQHVIDCCKYYIKNKPTVDTHNFQYDAQAKLQLYESWLAALENGKITIFEAPTNLFYKVGWAFNDTL